MVSLGRIEGWDAIKQNAAFVWLERVIGSLCNKKMSTKHPFELKEVRAIPLGWIKAQARVSDFLIGFETAYWARG